MMLKRFLVGFVTMTLIDIVWLKWIIHDVFVGEIGPLLVDEPLILAALLVWVVLIAGLLFFVHEHKRVTTLKDAFLRGALFGAVVYGVYDLTNIAVLDGWTWKLLIIDILWGTCLCGCISGLMWKVK